jgi:arylsulfatase A-like enzyme
MLAALAPAPALAAPAPRPNVILIFSDDHGHADLGAQGVDPDVRTPHLDQLAREGVRFVNGYVSAPQCTPSRAGVLTGRYQQRFGVERNDQGPLPTAELTIAERLKAAGYVSGQVGKWHLARGHGPGSDANERDADLVSPTSPFQPHGNGFDDYFCGTLDRYLASYDLRGRDLPDAPVLVTDRRFRVEVQTDAALTFLARHPSTPFFLYLAYLAPHLPLASPEPYFSKTPAHLPLERRKALAMIAAMDAGVGKLRSKLRELGLEKNTLIFFIGDNGASARRGKGGSLNDPFIGGKAMLTEGGIRTPFLAAWPGTLPAGKVFDAPVISLDVAATAVALAGLEPDGQLDGVDLMPHLLGSRAGEPQRALFWRWRSQAAVRAGRWKLIRLGPDKRYLFDLESREGETRNRIAEFPRLAADLETRLEAWSATLKPPGLPTTLARLDARNFAELVDAAGKSTP